MSSQCDDLHELRTAAVDCDQREVVSGHLAEQWCKFVRGERKLVAITGAGGRTLIVLGDSSQQRGLTPRQSRIVAMICGGASAKQVAIELGKGQPAVSKQVREALRTLGVASHVSLVNALGPWAASAIVPEKHPPHARLSVLRLWGESFTVIGFASNETRCHPSLTPAERAVVELVSLGFSNHAIAEARHRSPRTIANQLARTFDKLGVRSRVELVLALGTDVRVAARSGAVA